MLHSRAATCALVLAIGSLAVAGVRSALPGQEMPQPTEQHRQLLSGVGAWEGTLTSYMTDPPAAPVAARETVEAVGGFWIQSRFECQFMGMPYVGTGCVGYDAAKKKYIGTWVDSMSSHLALMEGEVDPATKALVLRWESPDETGKLARHRSESVETADGRTMTFYMGEGAGTKSMVIEMKRKAAKGAK